MNTPNPAPGLDPYRNMINALIDVGWNTTTDPRTNPAAQNPRTQLTCPANYLRMTIENTDDTNVSCRLDVNPGGTGEPARWRASTTNPHAISWLTATRTAQHAIDNPQHVNLYPGDALTRLGWRRLDTQIDPTTPRTVYTNPDTTSHLTYRPAHPARPAQWTITRFQTSIDILVSAAEPRALPAFILALAITHDHRTPRPAGHQADPHPAR